MKNVSEITFIKHEGRNIYFNLRTDEGFTGSYRIHYEDKSRKNSTYKDLRFLDVYFEGIPNLPNMFSSFNIEYVTNAMLLVERNAQWFLEHVTRMQE